MALHYNLFISYYIKALEVIYFDIYYSCFFNFEKIFNNITNKVKTFELTKRQTQFLN